MLKAWRAMIPVSCLCALASTVRADSITNMPDFVYDTTSGTAIAGGAFSWIAITFTVPRPEMLMSMEVPLEYGTGPNTMTFGIYSGTTSKPTTAIETLTVNNVPQFTYAMETLTSVLHPTLTPGTNYWLVQEQTSNKTAMNWGNNSQGQTGYYTTFNGTTWFNETGSSFVTPAYSVDFASSSPEPSTLLLASPLLFALVVRLRRRA